MASSNQEFRVTPFIKELDKLRHQLRATLADSEMSEAFLKCHVEWHLFTSWTDNILTNAVSNSDCQILKNFHPNLDYIDQVKLIYSDGNLIKLVRECVTQLVQYTDLDGCRKDLGRSRANLRKSLKESRKDKLRAALEYGQKALKLSPWPRAGLKQDLRTKWQLSFCLLNRSYIMRRSKSWNACETDLYAAARYAIGAAKSYCFQKRVTHELAQLTTQRPKKKKSGDRSPITATAALMKTFGIVKINDAFHGTAYSIATDYRENKGRILITRETVNNEKNSCVVAEDPFCYWLAPDLDTKYCSFCLRLLNDNYFPCRECTCIRYCDSACEEISWTNYHSRECKYYSLLRFMGVGHFVLRCLIMHSAQKARDAYKLSLRKNESQPIKCFQNNYYDIFSLKARGDKDGSSLETAFLATFLAQVAVKMGLIESYNALEVSAALVKQIEIIYLNSFFISDHGLDLVDPNSGNFSPTIVKEIGIGLYASSSLISHSCDPNCDKMFFGNKILIVANKPIQKDEEITISYGPLAAFHDFKKRQEMLEDSHDFKCACDVCLAEVTKAG